MSFELAYILACAVLALVCLYLIASNAYKDGLIGGLSLAIISGVCALQVADAMTVNGWYVAHKVGVHVTMVLAVSLLLIRQAWRQAFKARRRRTSRTLALIDAL